MIEMFGALSWASRISRCFEIDVGQYMTRQILPMEFDLTEMKSQSERTKWSTVYWLKGHKSVVSDEISPISDVYSWLYKCRYINKLISVKNVTLYLQNLINISRCNTS